VAALAGSWAFGGTGYSDVCPAGMEARFVTPSLYFYFFSFCPSFVIFNLAVHSKIAVSTVPPASTTKFQAVAVQTAARELFQRKSPAPPANIALPVPCLVLAALASTALQARFPTTAWMTSVLDWTILVLILAFLGPDVPSASQSVSFLLDFLFTSFLCFFDH
jgi:hypothetical protein